MKTIVEFIEAPKSWLRMPCWKRYHLRFERSRQAGMAHRKFKAGLL